MADALRPVVKVIESERTAMARVYPKPTFPTIRPKRRYMIKPNIVSTLGTDTPEKVPNFREPDAAISAIW